MLVEFFLNKYSGRLGKEIYAVDDEVMQIFMNYQWPGNVRELENVIEYALNMETNSILGTSGLPEYFRNRSRQLDDNDNSLKTMLQKYESQLLEEKIEKYGRSLEAKNHIAEELGIGIATLYRKLREQNLE